MGIVVEIIFLLQGKVFALLPIKILGAALNLVHQCLLHSLYSFEYKWFSQGIELHRRLNLVEINLPESQVMAGCVFSVVFPLFIVSGNQAMIEPSPGVPPINIFNPTITISNAIFSRSIQKNK